MTITEALKLVISGNSLNKLQAVDVFTQIMNGEATDAQIAAFIVALRMKGESVEEISGAAEVMRQKATHVLPQNCNNLIDTCGTGGDSSNTFNISTAVALVSAGAGASVAKHGNRSVSSKCGAADVLEALGVNINIDARQMGECIEKIGIGFLFAPSLHKAMKYAAGPRKEMGIRTIFNVLGPLTNPALAKRQLLGVFSVGLTETLAAVLNNMGTTKAFVVHGMDSLDEISISSATRISEVSEGRVKSYDIEPEQYGIERAPLESIRGDSARHNGAIINDILSGVKGPARDIVVLNSAFALCAAAVCENPKEGIVEAKKSIDSGSARDKLKELISVTNRFGN